MRTVRSSKVYRLGRTVTLRGLTCFLCRASGSGDGHTAQCVRRSVRSTRFFGGHLHVVRVSGVLPIVTTDGRRTARHSHAQVRVKLVYTYIVLAVVLVLAIIGAGRGGDLGGGQGRVTTRGGRLTRLGRQLVSAGGQHRACVDLFVSVDTLCVHGLSSCEGLIDEGMGTGRARSLLGDVGDFGLTRRRSSVFCVHFSGTFVRLCPGFIRRLGALLGPRRHVILPSPARLAARMEVCTLVELNMASDRRVTALLCCSARAVCGCGSKVETGTVGERAFRSSVGQLYRVVWWMDSTHPRNIQGLLGGS